MKPIFTIPVPPLEGRISVSRLLLLHGVSQRLRRRLKQYGTFQNENEIIQWSTPLYTGNTLYCYLEPSFIEKEPLLPYDYHLTILYEDEHIVIIDKPAGLLIHPTAKERYHTVANALMHYYKEKGESHYFHAIHRLDKNTSGVVMIAKNPAVQYAFDKDPHPMQKMYVAIVAGRFPAPYASIHFPIARKEGSIMERTTSLSGQRAHTDIHCLQARDTASYVSLTLHTGRTHQIRVHMNHLGHPLLGDDMYGGDRNDIKRQALHAHSLTFHHPITNTWHTILAPIPEDMVRLLNELKLI